MGALGQWFAEGRLSREQEKQEKKGKELDKGVCCRPASTQCHGKLWSFNCFPSVFGEQSTTESVPPWGIPLKTAWISLIQKEVSVLAFERGHQAHWPLETYWRGFTDTHMCPLYHTSHCIHMVEKQNLFFKAQHCKQNVRISGNNFWNVLNAK